MAGLRRKKISGRFGRLVVENFSHISNSGSAVWKCICDCGNVAYVTYSNLTHRTTRSCGCLLSETLVDRNVKNTKHGGSYSSEYKCWRSMLNRCRNTKDKDYHRWGGRGIEVRYKDFAEFFNDVGPRPSPNYSVDRYPNKNGHYEPGNCRWATRTEQQRNKNNNVVLTLNGTSRLLAEWAEILGVDHRRLRNRVRKGWSDQEALTIKRFGKRKAA